MAHALQYVNVEELYQNANYFVEHGIFKHLDVNMFVQALSDVECVVMYAQKQKVSKHIAKGFVWSSFICVFVICNVISYSKLNFTNIFCILNSYLKLRTDIIIKYSLFSTHL